jgi:hypothetical protein
MKMSWGGGKGEEGKEGMRESQEVRRVRRRADQERGGRYGGESQGRTRGWGAGSAEVTKQQEQRSLG